MNMFFIGALLLFVSGIFAKLFPKNFRITFISVVGAIASILCLIPAVSVFFNAETLEATFNFNSFFGPVNFAIDGLSAFFIVVISAMSLVSVIYSKGYLKAYIEKGKSIDSHMFFLTGLIASMLLVVTCQNAMMFLICWELMSLSSFFLVTFENEKKEIRRAGLKYLVFMHISVLFIIAGFAAASISAGSFSFSEISAMLQQNSGLANTVFMLCFVGFGIKAGFVPFHNWLPDAHPAAPSHVSAIMSGVMIKTGIYGILRVLALLAVPSKAVAYTVLIIAVLSSMYGVLYAITQHDLKRLLAYHSIENIGIIGIGIGTGMLGLAYGNDVVALLGFAGGILHILNHSIFKELLFLSAGSVYTQTHTRDIEALGGLAKSMPYSAGLFLIGSVAICGLPPFNGFISEFLVYYGMMKGLVLHDFVSFTLLIFVIAGLAIVGTMAILCFTKAFSIIFLGMPRTESAQLAVKTKGDVCPSMILPMCFLALLTLVIGLLPQYVFELLSTPVSVVLKGDLPVIGAETFEIMQIISIVAFAFLAFVAIMAGLKKLFGHRISYHETWGCGYDRPNNRMQYTASSYASPFLAMLKPLFKKVFDIEKPKKLFPKSAHFSLHIDDIEEAYVINPVVKFDEWFLSKFEVLQSGNIQTYIKFGLIFLLLIMVGSFLIK